MYKTGLLVVVITTIFATVILPAAALANGRVMQFERKIAGPYEIALGTIPTDPLIGNLHLTINVTEIATKILIADAHVTVVGIGPRSTEIEIGPLIAKSNAIDPTFYDVNTSVNREGTWTFTTAIKTEQGNFDASFSIEVKDASPIMGIITLVVLVMLLIILSVSIRAFIGERGIHKS